MTKVCCECKQIKVNNTWEQSPIPLKVAVTHGYCPKCYDALMKKLHRYMVGSMMGAAVCELEKTMFPQASY